MKKLSIIVVTFNAGRYIENTISSIIPFLDSDIELICKDGGSSDNTLKLLEKYSEHISLLEIEKDSSVYDGMNQAVEISNGEYIMFINAGDEVIKLDIDGLVDSATCFYWDEARDVIKRDKVTSCFLTRNTPCHQSVIYKRSDFLEYNLDYGLAADFEQLVRIVKLRGKRFSTNSSIVKYANPGLSSQYYNPTLAQLMVQLRQRYKTIEKNFGMIERLLCVIFSTRTILIKLVKEISK